VSFAATTSSQLEESRAYSSTDSRMDFMTENQRQRQKSKNKNGEEASTLAFAFCFLPFALSFPMIFVQNVSKLYRIYDLPAGSERDSAARAAQISPRFFWAFENINVEVRPAKPSASSGGNGAGRRRLLQIIAGVLPADARRCARGKAV